MENIAILGAREHAKVVCTTLEDMATGKHKVVLFLDDNTSLHGNKTLDVPVAGPIAKLSEYRTSSNLQGALIGVSCNYMPVRKKLYDQIMSLGLSMPTVISPTAHVHRRASVGHGTLVCSGSVVHAFAKVGSNCVLYSNSTVEHDCVIGDNVFLGPGVNFCGDVKVGSNTFIGTGANVICPRIGSDVIVGAGAVVTQDLPDGAVAVGVPAKVIRIRTPEERLQPFILRDHTKTCA